MRLHQLGDLVPEISDVLTSSLRNVRYRRLVRTTPVALVVALALGPTGCGSPAKHAANADEPTPAPTTNVPSASPPATPSPPAVATTVAPPPSRPATSKAAAPPGSIATNRRCEAPPAASTGGYPRTITVSAPLDLLMTGDSLQESSGPQLTAYANTKRHVVAGCTVPKYSTGLVRDDYFNWRTYAKQLAAERDPEAVSFMIGGNDGQNMSVDGRILDAGSSEWAAEYQRRAAAVMAAFANGQRKVYWIGMPIPRSDRLRTIYQVLNAAVRKAASTVPAVQFVDIWAMYAPDGHYQDSFANEYGTVERMRNSDGIHLSVAGAGYLARRMLRILDADWHLTG